VTHREGRRRLLVLAGLLLYAALSASGPALHHDFDCHLKTPGHCGACTANPPAFGAEPVGSLGTTTFHAAEIVERGRTSNPAAPSLTLRSERSPPF
jgi:hypothetical protein